MTMKGVRDTGEESRLCHAMPQSHTGKDGDSHLRAESSKGVQKARKADKPIR